MAFSITMFFIGILIYVIIASRMVPSLMEKWLYRRSCRRFEKTARRYKKARDVKWTNVN